MKNNHLKFIFTVVFAALGWQSNAHAARDYIGIVGSSMVYPFATVVAEQFGKTSRYNGCLRLFCGPHRSASGATIRRACGQGHTPYHRFPCRAANISWIIHPSFIHASY